MTLNPVLTYGRFKVTSSIVITMSLEFSTLRAEGRNIRQSTEVNWFSKVNSHWCGRHARKTCWWLLACRFEQKSFSFVLWLHKVHSIERKTSQRIHVVRGEIDKCSNDYQTRSCVALRLTKIGKAAQNREKQEWNNEKPKLDNARRLRGIYFIDLDDQDYKTAFKNANKNLERPMAATMPCKRKAQTSTAKVAAKQEIATQKIPNTIYGCIVESQESTRQRLEPWTSNGRSSRQFWHGIWKKSRARRRLFSKHK